MFTLVNHKNSLLCYNGKLYESPSVINFDALSGGVSNQDSCCNSHY